MHLDRRGFTLIEVIVAVTLGSVVLAATYQTIISTQRASQSIAQRMAVQQNLRTASHYLNLALRETSASGGDLFAITNSSMTFRGMRWTGYVCRDATQISATEVELEVATVLNSGLRPPDMVLDSILVYREGDETLIGDDAWMFGAIKAIGTGVCLAGGVSTRLRVELNAVAGGADSAATGVFFGAPIRGFQIEELSSAQFNGRAWMAQRTANASGQWTPVQALVGPLDTGGFAFVYRDAAGSVTTNRVNVQTVEYIIKAASPNPTRLGDGSIGYVIDSIATRVFVRNNARY